jgi:hypothetical protein
MYPGRARRWGVRPLLGPACCAPARQLPVGRATAWCVHCPAGVRLPGRRDKTAYPSQRAGRAGRAGRRPDHIEDCAWRAIRPARDAWGCAARTHARACTRTAQTRRRLVTRAVESRARRVGAALRASWRSPARVLYALGHVRAARGSVRLGRDPAPWVCARLLEACFHQEPGRRCVRACMRACTRARARAFLHACVYLHPSPDGTRPVVRLGPLVSALCGAGARRGRAAPAARYRRRGAPPFTHRLPPHTGRPVSASSPSKRWRPPGGA